MRAWAGASRKVQVPEEELKRLPRWSGGSGGVQRLTRKRGGSGLGSRLQGVLGCMEMGADLGGRLES